MNQDKMYLINKIFNNETIRIVWDKEREKYFISVVDVADIEGIFRIIESIPSKKAEPIKQWLAKLGSERIDEIFDPSLVAQRSIDLYRAKGCDEKWIDKRLKSIQDRKKLTDVWKDGGNVAKVAKDVLENKLGEKLVTNNNKLNYKNNLSIKEKEKTNEK